MESDKKEVKIMTDKGPWNFTEEEIYRIKSFDPVAVNQFFFDNYSLLYRLARKYNGKKSFLAGNVYCEVDDLVNQVYIDLPLYNFSTRSGLYHSVLSSFWAVCVGGRAKQGKMVPSGVSHLSLDADLTESGLTLEDLLTDNRTPYDDVVLQECMEENDRKILAFIESQYQGEELNRMFCYLFTDLPASAIEGNEYESFKKDTTRAAR